MIPKIPKLSASRASSRLLTNNVKERFRRRPNRGEAVCVARSERGLRPSLGLVKGQNEKAHGMFEGADTRFCKRCPK